MDERTQGLRTAAAHAERFLGGVGERPVRASVDAAAVKAALGGPLPHSGEDANAVIDALAIGADPGIVASNGPRHFGFVMGGALGVGIAADWLASAWDQAPGFYVLSPAAAAVEEIAGEWLLDLLGLPAGCGFGFVTGAQGANTTGLAAARHAVLAREGWDVERDGLHGAPRITVVVGERAHATIPRSMRLLGLGGETAVRVAADDQGRMRPEALADALRAADGPAIVCAQAGEVNTGAFDPLDAIADLCAERRAWLHVDGAFGLWAAASPRLRHLTAGAERADSWAVDFHKWLNVPYDSAMAFVRDPAVQGAAMAYTAAYLVTEGEQRNGATWSPESSRRARGFAVYATLRHLGREGVAAMIERNCAQAQRMAERLAALPNCTLLNEVVLNQVLVRFDGGDEVNQRIVAAVQQDGTCWLGGTVWEGRQAIRVSFSNWSTTDEDVDRSADVIARAAS
jgi:glutamate/tyrosine decarboxylase-like PLP-dependent enzyme